MSASQSQSHAEARAAGMMSENKSTLAVSLIQMCPWGFASPQVVQNLCACAIQDIDDKHDLSLLRKLAKAGTGGRHANNVHGDLMKTIVHDCGMQQPFSETTPFKKCGEMKQSMLLPHETFASIYNNYPAEWKKNAPKASSLVYQKL